MICRLLPRIPGLHLSSLNGREGNGWAAFFCAVPKCFVLMLWTGIVGSRGHAPEKPPHRGTIPSGVAMIPLGEGRNQSLTDRSQVLQPAYPRDRLPDGALSLQHWPPALPRLLEANGRAERGEVDKRRRRF